MSRQYLCEGCYRCVSLEQIAAEVVCASADELIVEAIRFEVGMRFEDCSYRQTDSLLVKGKIPVEGELSGPLLAELARKAREMRTSCPDALQAVTTQLLTKQVVQ